MNIKSFSKFFGIIILGLILSGCQAIKEANKPFKHNTPLIKDNIKKEGRAEIQKTLELGPKPAQGKKVYGKRKKISSEAQRNFFELLMRFFFSFRKLFYLEQVLVLVLKFFEFQLYLLFLYYL